MLFTEFKQAKKDKKLQEKQSKELEQKFNDEASKVKKLKRDLRKSYTGLHEIFMEGFGYTSYLISETDSDDEELTECQNCFKDFKWDGERLPSKFKAPVGVMCPLCVKCWMASTVSFSP